MNIYERQKQREKERERERLWEAEIDEKRLEELIKEVKSESNS